MIGKTFKLGLYWIEVDSYSPESRIVRFRRLARTASPIFRMGAKAFAKQARAA